MHYDRYPHGLISGSQQQENWSAGAEPQTHDIRCLCTLLLKDVTPFSVMLPTTLSGKLFQTCTAVWMKVRPVEMVLETGTARAWQGIDRLERVALLTTNG